MANQFSVDVPSFDKAFASGEEGYSAISRLMQAREVKQAREDAAQNVMRGGDPQASLARLIGAGDLQGAALFHSMQQHSPEGVAAVDEAKAKVADKYAPKTIDIKRPGPLGETVTETMQRGPNGIVPLQVQGRTQQPSNLYGGPQDELTGESYLKTLPVGMATIAKKLANHEILPQYLSVKGGHRENMIAAASKYDPEYDAALAPARFAAIKEFNSGGPNAPASTIVAGNTAIQHLKTLSDASQKIGGFSNLGPLNSTANSLNVAYEGAKNSPDLVEYNGALGRFVEEATKFYRGIGGNEADIQRAIKDVTAAQSPEARNRAIAVQADLMQSKINALQSRYKQAMGPKQYTRATESGDFPIVQEKSIGALNEILKRDGRPPYSVEKPATKPTAAPPKPAADALRGDPNLRDQFDAKYGAGASKQVLGW